MRMSLGFSLAELLVTVSVAAILLALATPSFSNMMKDNRRAAAVTELVVSLQYARNMALHEGREFVVCPHTGDGNCAERPHWNAGWMVFANTDADQPPVRDIDEPVLRVSGALDTGLSLRANRDAFEFRPFISSTNGTFVICDARGPEHATAVIVSIMGRTRLQKKVMPDGTPLVCAES